MIDTAVESYGRLDVLINNAGIQTRTSLLDTTEADFGKVMAINMNARSSVPKPQPNSSSPRVGWAGFEHLIGA